MCRVAGVSPESFYASRRPRAAGARAVADDRLLAQIRLAHRESDGRYGAPRVTCELRAGGAAVGHNRVARLMRRDGLVGRRPAAFVRTTDAAHAYPVAPNLLERQFAAAGLRVNEAWVSDLTYVRTREGWLYLAVVLDLASRRVVGWATGETLAAELPLRALGRALRARRPGAGLIHHSDRGVQYACPEYQAVLAQHGAWASMSRKGDCWDNAVAESFFATLKVELGVAVWPTRAAAHAALYRYIEFWYNRVRRHSTLDYRSPAEYEREVHGVAA
jgi:putative transposase